MLAKCQTDRDNASKGNLTDLCDNLPVETF